MARFKPGDRVRVDVPDETDPDFDRYHGCHGVIMDVSKDAAGRVSGDERDSVRYRVELDDGETADFRWRDLRPAVEDK